MGATVGSVLIVAGPTGSGKSRLAMVLAARLHGTIINADALQVYRELRVLTNRPTLADEASVPHRLYGVLSAAERCSSGRWLSMAAVEIENVRTARRLPVVVGGTGLYLKALTEGLSLLPPVPEPVRAEACALYDRLGGERFRRLVHTHDPETAARLPATDRQRLVRALEVALATGTPLTEWHRRHPPVPLVPARFVTVVTMPDREALYAGLDARFEAMLAAGALGEVRALLDLGLDPQLPAMKAVAVRELAAHLRGDLDFDQAVAAAKRTTRRYAKRQMTWLRHQLAADVVVGGHHRGDIDRETLALVKGLILTARA
jgi:tRNA dimethylallyltransferase